MKREEIHQAIVANIDAAGDEDADVRVQPDPFGGWRIAVISDLFRGLPHGARRGLALSGLENLELEWADFVTVEERAWAGTLPSEAELDDLPFWPEALGRARLNKKSHIFPSDLDEDLELPVVATFYSLRGGAGRSTALAYTARILARGGRRVVMVDLDLEAPALAALFGQESELDRRHGVVDLLLQLDRGETPDFSKHLLRLDSADELYLLPAGRVDAEYARKLRFIDPLSWYREERNPLHLLLAGLREGLPFIPDAVLLDARTGLSPLSSPLLFDLADLAVVVFFPHPQSETGTGALVSGLMAATTSRSVCGGDLTPEPRFVVSPLPASKAREIVERYEHRALEWIAEWLRTAGVDHGPEADITHFVKYREEIATSDVIREDSDTWRTYEPISQWVEQFLPTPGEQKIAQTLGDLKPKILRELTFSTGTAERQEDLPEIFVRTSSIDKALAPDTPLVVGRKGTGKTAIFRVLAENAVEDYGHATAVLHAPMPLRGQREYLLSSDGFEAIEKALNDKAAEWRHFWVYYVCLATAFSAGSQMLPPQLQHIVHMPSKQEETVSMFRQLLRVEDFALHLLAWLRELDAALDQRYILLLDGLDTGFGNSTAERRRRGDAITGLFSFWTDQGEALERLRFKIFLRDDIWRQLVFENKSHLFGRSVSLQWTHQDEYLKVALKQAMRSHHLQDYLRQHLPRVRPEVAAVDAWSQEETRAVWNVLVSERMKGGNTTFTRNWIWKRLADGNDDHTPRYLLQLFHRAKEWEQEEHARNPHGRSVIRPRALEQTLPGVSSEALDAIREEFRELDNLLERLREIGYTPVKAGELEDRDLGLGLAREVGVLAVYEGTEERVERYRVPEIYRHALNMKRPGQR